MMTSFLLKTANRPAFASFCMYVRNNQTKASDASLHWETCTYIHGTRDVRNWYRENWTEFLIIVQLNTGWTNRQYMYSH